MTPQELKKEFDKDFDHLKRFGLEFMGVVREVKDEEISDDFNNRELDKSRDIISIQHPFIFDNRQIPETYLGFQVQNAFYGDNSSLPITDRNYFPPEFDVDKNDDKIPLETYWDPNKFIAFVDRCEGEIREILDSPSITKSEILDILAFGDFKKHVNKCKEWKLRRNLKK